MSRRTAAHSITKMALTEVSPLAVKSRLAKLSSPSIDTSIAAWPSMEPASSFAACARAASVIRPTYEEAERRVGRVRIRGWW